jgi:hypothetical protein
MKFMTLPWRSLRRGGGAERPHPDSPDTVTKMLRAAEAGRAQQAAAQRRADLRCNPAFEDALRRSQQA